MQASPDEVAVDEKSIKEQGRLSFRIITESRNPSREGSLGGFLL
jgi:hypothetical protein